MLLSTPAGTVEVLVILWTQHWESQSCAHGSVLTRADWGNRRPMPAMSAALKYTFRTSAVTDRQYAQDSVVAVTEPMVSCSYDGHTASHHVQPHQLKLVLTHACSTFLQYSV